MPLSHLTVNQEGQELKTHGTIALPIAIYDDDLLIEPVPYHWHFSPHQAPACRAQRPHPGIHPYPPSSPLSALSVQSALPVSVFFHFLCSSLITSETTALA